jgi:hypothetical protein
MKKDTFYFSHDYNAHNDVKILYMRQELGMEGYGIYWFLIESLADSGGILPLKIVPVLAKQMDSTQVKVEAVIMNYELFDVNDKEFFSIRLLQHIELRNGLSAAGKIGAQKRWKNGGAISPPNAKESKGKERKVKESKESNVTLANSNLYRQPTIPTIEEVNHAFLQSGGTLEMSKIFFEKNNATGWFLKGSPIVNFRNLLPSFITNFKTNEQRSKTRQQSTNETINYIKQKGAALYTEIIAENNRGKE